MFQRYVQSCFLLSFSSLFGHLYALPLTVVSLPEEALLDPSAGLLLPALPSTLGAHSSLYESMLPQR
jgi:hypothetical protein